MMCRAFHAVMQKLAEKLPDRATVGQFERFVDNAVLPSPPPPIEKP